MKNLEVKTIKPGGLQVNAKYNLNVKSVTTFLRHSEDRITVNSGETVNIEIYDNGECIYIGYKEEFFELLRKLKEDDNI